MKLRGQEKFIRKHIVNDTGVVYTLRSDMQSWPNKSNPRQNWEKLIHNSIRVKP